MTKETGKIEIACIYFDGEKCRVIPIHPPELKLGLPHYYSPTKEISESYCKTNQFQHCPRLKVYKELLEALKK